MLSDDMTLETSQGRAIPVIALPGERTKHATTAFSLSLETYGLAPPHLTIWYLFWGFPSVLWFCDFVLATTEISG